MSKQRDDGYTDDVDFVLGEKMIDFLPHSNQIVRRQKEQHVIIEIPKHVPKKYKISLKII